MSQNRYASGLLMKGGAAITLKSSAAQTSSTSGSALDTSDAGSVYVVVDVTAASGGDAVLTVVIEGSIESSS
jgi:hypothetical protein